MTASLLLILALASPASAEGLRLELLRPAGADPVLGVRALRVFAAGEVPCAGAKVILTLPGGLSTEARAEASGTARFDPRSLSYLLPASGAASLSASAQCGALKAKASFGVSAAELHAYIEKAVESLTEEGVRLANSGKLREARAAFVRALELDPACERAGFNLALADEKLGRARLAVSEYVRYLLLHPKAPDRAALERKAARMARHLKPGPALPREAVDFFEKGRGEAASGRYAGAAAAFAAAQAVAPWWAEPYRAAGLLREHLAAQGNFLTHCEGALAEYQSFLEIAPEDGRASDIKARMEHLRGLRAGLKAPERIPIQ